MKTENQSCCFCFNIASQGNVVDSDILDLLKFLVVNLNTSALENCPVCDNCLNKILETSEYKRKNSTKTLVDMKKDCEKSICHKCEKVCEQGDIFPLINRVTQIDWSDFVNYLFVDHDSQSLENLQICGSCRESVSNIQDFLMLIYVHDQSKMKCDIDNSDNIILTENENLVKNKVEIKQEFKNFIVNDKTEFQNKVDENKAEMICSDSKGDGDTTYADFKCLNEEIELKFENSSDDDQSSKRCEQVDDKELTSGGGPNKNSFNNEETEGVNSQGCRNRLRYNLKVQNNTRDFKCSHCSKRFVLKSILDNHLLRSHKCSDGVTSKIHDCSECKYITTNKNHMLRHRLKHGITIGIKKYKCQNCIYETYDRTGFVRHTKTHKNTRDFKCTLCSKSFTNKINLDYHLLKVHKNKDSVVSKIHECDKCSYLTTNKRCFLKHKIKHDITIGFEKYICDKCNYSTTKNSDLLKHKLIHGITAHEKYECYHCTYKTYIKSNLNTHIKTHYDIRDFKCTLCSKKFTQRVILDNHFLKVHKNKKSVTSKIHECKKCSYFTTYSTDLTKHLKRHNNS